MSTRKSTTPTPPADAEPAEQDESGKTVGDQDATGLRSMATPSTDASRHGQTAPPTNEPGRSGRAAINDSGTPEVVPADKQANDDAGEGETPTVGANLPRNAHHQKADRADTSDE